MRKDLFVRPALSAAIVLVAGSALAAGTAGQAAQTPQGGAESGIITAQSGTNAPPGGKFPEREGGAQTPRNGQVGPDTGAQPSTGMLDIPNGTDVVDADGRKVGEVAGESADKVIISVSEYLGMGGRQIALDRDQLHVVAGKSQLQTTMSTEELRRLPQFEGADLPPGDGVPEREGGTQAPSQ